MTALLLTLCTLLPSPSGLPNPFHAPRRELISWNGKSVSTISRGGVQWLYVDGRDYWFDGVEFLGCRVGEWREWPPGEVLEARR